MEASNTESPIDSDLLATFPRDSLLALIRQMSAEIKELRSQVEVLERRNATLQDRLPEIIQTTIRSTLNSRSDSTVADNRQNSGNTENGKSPNYPNAIPVSIDIGGGGGPVIPPTIFSMANNLPSSSPPVSSLTFESTDFTELLNSLLQSSPKNTPVETSLSTLKLPISVSQITGKSLSNEASNLPSLPSLTPPNYLKEEESRNGNDDDEIGERNDAPPSFITPMPPLPPRPTGNRSEVSSLLSSEVMAQIEDQILSSSSMTERRKQYWQIYLNSKEWTRATCALMSCLFTRTQMANSTVLGRSSQVGGEIRHRLPATLVHYIVTKINQRFGVNPVKIRARMAQKCKDLRR